MLSWKRSGSYLTLILVIAGLALWGKTFGFAQSSDPVSPEWWDTLPPNQNGFPVAVSGAYFVYGSSPTLADLDKDGKLEVIAAGRDLVGGSPACSGKVYAYRHNGTLFWQTPVRATVNSTPTVADLNGDGFPDVIVGLGGFEEPPCWHGGVVALNGLNGQELWTFETQDWLNHSPDGWQDGVFSTPAAGDINADGQPEVVFGAWDQCIYLLNRNGQPMWGNLPGHLAQVRCGGHGFYNEDTVWSSPALADVTGDGRLEIIIGADISEGNFWGNDDGGYLYILDADGDTLARKWMNQAIFSSPAVADLDGDREFEFVVGTGTFVPGTGYYVTAFDYDSSRSDPANRLIQKWRPTTVGRVFASPAISDLDGDGLPDVVITVLTGENGADGTFVYAWRGSDGVELFKRRMCDFWGNSGNSLSSPTVADIVGDDRPEILFSHQWEVSILRHDGTYYTDYSNPKWSAGPNHLGCARDHSPATELTYWARYSLYSSPAVGDLDADGDAEVVIIGHNPDNPNQGMLFAWTGHTNGDKPWPMFHRDAQHTGRYPLAPGLAVSPSALFALHQSGSSNPETLTLLLRNTGGQSFNWSATTPAGVSLSPATGNVTDYAAVVVTVSTSGYGNGMHNLGNVVVTATANGSSITGSPVSIPVMLYVGEVSRLFLPTVLRSFGP